MSPMKPARPCRYPGCPNLTDDKSGFCDAHRKAEMARYDSQRGTATQRGYDSRWAEYSRLYRKEHPLCVMCEAEGRIVVSEVVDHIKAVTGPDDPLFWEPSNHQALCLFHHSQKTMNLDGGFGHGR